MPTIDFLDSNNLATALESILPDASKLQLAVAYVTNIPEPIMKFIKQKREVQLLVGLSKYQSITNPKSIDSLLKLKERKRSSFQKLKMKFYDDPRFHPKLLILTGESRITVIVGSSNLTASGYGKNGKGNAEANILLSDSIRNKGRPLTEAQDYFGRLWKSAKTVKSSDLVKYGKSYDERKASVKAETKNNGENLSVPLPKSKEKSKKRMIQFEILIDGQKRFVNSLQAVCMWRNCIKVVELSKNWSTYWDCDKHGPKEHYDYPRHTSKLETELPKLRELKSVLPPLTVDKREVVYPPNIEVLCQTRRCGEEMDATNSLYYVLCLKHYNALPRSARHNIDGVRFGIPKSAVISHD